MKAILTKENQARKALSGILRGIADWVDSYEPFEQCFRRIRSLYDVTNQDQNTAVDWLAGGDSIDWIVGQND